MLISEKKTARLAIYSRKSKFTDKGDSVGNQIELAKEYIKLHYPESEYNVQCTIYEDEGFSAGSLNRPQFKKFLTDENKNPYDSLICYRLDRISRNVADFSGLINKLNELGTTFVSIKEQFDTKTPMGRAMMYIASVFAQLEREVIAERITDNLLELAKTGTWLGGDTPLGFKAERFKKVDICEEDNENNIVKKSKMASKLVINEQEIKIAKLIFSKYLELKSLSKLETYLMNNDIKTRKGCYYSLFSLKLILTNPVYVKNDKDVLEYFRKKNINVFAEEDKRNKFDGSYGFLTYNKTSNRKSKPVNEWIIAVGLHPGIITGKEWIAVQTILENNKSKSYRACSNPKKETIAAGLIKCKKCGSNMRARNMDKRKSDGTVNYRYCCSLKEKSKLQKCDGLNVSGEQLDNKIIDIIKETYVPNSEIYKELKNIANQKKNHIGSVKKSKSIMREESQAKDILSIIDNSFKIFDEFDLKTKKDITSLFIESIYGNGEDVEINFLNTKIDAQKKFIFFDVCLPTDKISIYSH